MMHFARWLVARGATAGLVLLGGCLIERDQGAPDGVKQTWQALVDPEATYTLDDDFEQGTLVNVVHNPLHDQLQLDDTVEAFNFLWVAVSTAGTAVKIDTRTGAVLGEYRTCPAGRGADPSRTTVDQNGSAWVANRAEVGWVAENAVAAGLPATTRRMGSVVHIGLLENGGCEDRNGNGAIDTSTGLGDVRPWSNVGGADDLGGVTTADDECIIHYTRVNSYGTRHVSVNADNDVWVSGLGARHFDLLDGATGQIIRQEPEIPRYGGYGGLIDPSGVIWSASKMLRWNTALPLSEANSRRYDHESYGLCIDSAGNVWNTAFFGNQIRKFAPDGTLLGTFGHGEWYAQGCVVDRNDDVWVAHSVAFGANTVGHIKNDGTLVGNVDLSEDSAALPTGVAVDGDGYIWATGYQTRMVYKIDPSAGPIGADGATPVGRVVLATVDLGGSLYNYSDMTGSTLTGRPDMGTWSVIHDSGIAAAEWGTVTWTANEPGDSTVEVQVASSEDGVVFGQGEIVAPGVDLTVANGRYLRVTVTFTRATTDENGDGSLDSPVLYDLSLEAITNDPPVAVCADRLVVADAACTGAASIDEDSSDPDGDPLTLTQIPASPYALGAALVRLEVSDGELTDTCEATVTVVDGEPPQLTCPAPVQVECANGSARVDPGDALAVDTCSAIASLTDPGLGEYPLGTTGVLYSAVDVAGNAASCQTSVTAQDTTGPVVTVASMIQLWPSDHKYVTITLADCGIAFDACHGSVDLGAAGTIQSIYSDEVEDAGGGGDGTTLDDIVLVNARTFRVRAERQGGGNGRVYGVVFTVSDVNGNRTEATCRVGVPHDQHGAAPADDGPEAGYTVP